MSHNAKVDGYVKPGAAEVTARKRRNYAIGGALFAFCVLIFCLMMVRLSGGAA